MKPESQHIEYKSLKKVLGPKADLKNLAEHCVAFANAQGGIIVVGIEDNEHAPPLDQTIAQELVNDVISRLRSLTSSVGISNAEIIKHENGSEYFQFNIFSSSRTIATTTSGKVYIRIGDRSMAVSGDELTHLAAEKTTFQWELVGLKNIRIENIEGDRIKSFVDDIRKSDRVKAHVKQKSDIEILENYNLLNNGSLTNIGVLWLGNAAQRSHISYPITVQYIVYDENDKKISKEDWHDYSMNPKELLLDIEEKATELRYFYEFPNGLFRKRIPHYAPEVIRELLINAIAHKSYTISGDIFIEVYPDRLEITNPGKLPLGITKDNILHSKHRRNPHMIRVFHDLKLMEGEGSGFDLIYEIDSRDSKPFPSIISEFDSTKIIQPSRIIDEDSLFILEYLMQYYELSQREFIVLGVITREKKMLSTQLSDLLQLQEEERLRNYVGRLVERAILITRGNKKGTEYLLNPKIIENSRLNIKPTLKTIELHRLKALIEEDLTLHPNSRMEDFHSRIPDVDLADLRKAVYSLVKVGVLLHTQDKTYRKYYLAKKNRNDLV